MAYGLDVTDLIYTDANLYDQGTLENHEIDLDVAVEKDFELRSDDHIMENGSLWYVDGTEFGGIVGSFETDPDNYQVIYKGRSFRGIQDKKIIEVEDGKNVAEFQGAISSVVNQILEDYDLSDFFYCKSPQIATNADINTIVPKTDVIAGTTVYDAIIKIGESIGFSYLYEFSAKDKKVYMIPILEQDWTDVMAYNRDNTAKFKSMKKGDFVNHLICSGLDEKGKRRTIHLFLDADGVLQPYATVDTPIKDEHYILDKSKKVLTGVKEIAEPYEGTIGVEDNYELLEEIPEDWNIFFGNYYTRNISEQVGEYESKEIGENRIVEFGYYVTLDGLSIVQQETELVAGTDWNLYDPETVTIFYFAEDYRNWPVKIANVDYTVDENCIVEVLSSELPAEYSVSSDAKMDLYGYTTSELELYYDYSKSEVTRSKKIQTVSEYGVGEYISVADRTQSEDTYDPVYAVEEINYTLQSTEPADFSNNYTYYFKRSWDETAMSWSYSSYSADTVTSLDLTKLNPVTSKPVDWSTMFGQYYYLFFNGFEQVPVAYSGKNLDIYTALPAKPDDWNDNFSSYYRKAYQVTYTKKGKKKQKVVHSAADAKKYKSSEEIYESVPEMKKKKGQKNYHKWPDFVPNKYYTRTTLTDPPVWDSKTASNCYLPGQETVAPSYDSTNCYKESRTAKAPEFQPDTYYRLVEDHYAQLVRNGAEYLLSQTNEDNYSVTIDDYDLNIGDTVGGEDEITGLNIPQKVTNKIIKITRGVVYVDYEIGG